LTGNFFGGVGYNYNIGTYDVTNSQYVEFLNTKDPTGANALGLWNGSMANATFGGISFNGGNVPGSRYVLTAGRENHPVNYVTWYDTIRFANWLNNGQGSGDTETGAYTLGRLGAGGIPLAPPLTHNADSQVWLPTENEWYKAAYYDPRTTAQGGPPVDSHYWLYGTSSSSTPIASGPTALANHANYNNAVGNLTDVGAYTGTTSPYGAFDMAGNIFQWNETWMSGVSRGVRGGAFNVNFVGMHSSARVPSESSFEFNYFGFRVASTIPEPSSVLLGAFALAALAALGWRRAHRGSSFRRCSERSYPPSSIHA
jgi:formylglycine-generating enzyme